MHDAWVCLWRNPAIRLNACCETERRTRVIGRPNQMPPGRAHRPPRRCSAKAHAPHRQELPAVAVSSNPRIKCSDDFLAKALICLEPVADSAQVELSERRRRLRLGSREVAKYWWEEMRCGQRGRRRFARIESRSRPKDRSGATIASNPLRSSWKDKVGATVWVLLPRAAQCRRKRGLDTQMSAVQAKNVQWREAQLFIGALSSRRVEIAPIDRRLGRSSSSTRMLLPFFRAPGAAAATQSDSRNRRSASCTNEESPSEDLKPRWFAKEGAP